MKPIPQKVLKSKRLKGVAATMYCEVCGKAFDVPIVRKQFAKYCSPKCRRTVEPDPFNG